MTSPRITGLRVGRVRVPLRRPFTTALRSVDCVDDLIVQVLTDDGVVGWGEAPPTPQVTGEDHATIRAAWARIGAAIRGVELADRDGLARQISGALEHNTSAKAAVDIACHDALARSWGISLVHLLGGVPRELTTNITISVDEPTRMVVAALEAVARGFTILKVKLGDPTSDLDRLVAIHRELGERVRLRADANQAWTPQQAVSILGRIAESGITLDLVEQPVAAADIDGLRFVTQHTDVPVLADESVFNAHQAQQVIRTGAADLVNIKLMKAGGFHGADQIATLAEINGVGVFMGSMLETRLSITAAAHLASSRRSVVAVDLDGPVLTAEDPVVGGVRYDRARMTLPDGVGLGIDDVTGVVWDDPA